MQIGQHFWFGYDIPAKDRILMLANAGFDCIMLWGGDEYTAQNGCRTDEIPAIAKAHGLWVENIHAPYAAANSLWLPGQEGDDMLHQLLEQVDLCSRHGIGTVVVHLTRSDAPPAPGKLGLARLEKLADYAAAQNVAVALENLRRPAYLDFVFQNLPHPALHFCFDSGHQNAWSSGGGLPQKYGHLLAALHLHDNDGADDWHWLPGDGSINWPDIAAGIRESAYNGPITLESAADQGPQYLGMPPEEFLRLSCLRAREIAAMAAQ